MATTAVEIRGRAEQPPAEAISSVGGPVVRPLFGLRVVRPEEMEPRPVHVLLGTLSTLGFRVIKAIPVILRTEGSTVIASWRDIDEFGTGASMSSACEDLGRTIVELFVSLKADSDKLGPDLKRVWGLLQQHVVEGR